MNRRKRLKQGKLRAYQYQSILARYLEFDVIENWTDSLTWAVASDMEWETPYQTIAQDRHDRRVFGHSVLDCPGKGCTIDKIEAAVAWNQPPKGWAGGGREYHRRTGNRRKRR